MAGITIKLDGLEHVVKELERRGLDAVAGIEAICTSGAIVIERAAEDKAHGDVDILHETVLKAGPRVSVAVGPHKKNRIAKWLEYGTKTHLIPKRRKRKRKVLYFNGVFRYSVRHPGARKRPYLRPAFDENQGKAQAAMASKTKQVVRA